LMEPMDADSFFTMGTSVWGYEASVNSRQSILTWGGGVSKMVQDGGWHPRMPNMGRMENRRTMG
jgi:hypothetical protein